MPLPAHDALFLSERHTPFTVQSEANMTCVVIPDFELPPGYDRPRSTLLVRLSPGYPDVPPDMWWFNPPVQRSDGAPIPATQCTEQHLGATWQRWSRHFQQGQWQSGIDCLETFLALVRRELERCANGSVR
jgi:Prokaryotic E2 family E